MSSSSNYQYSIVVVCSTMIVLIVLCLVFQRSADQGLPIGSAMPELPVTTSCGENICLDREIGLSIIVFFRYKCKHCQYQLNIIEQNLGIFSNIRLYLLTDKASFFQTGKHKDWQKLLFSENVLFAYVNKIDFKKRFDILITPSIYIFDNDGFLVSKIYGEVKLQKLLKELHKAVEFIE